MKKTPMKEKQNAEKQKKKNNNFVFHIIPNAHLDPVWLWDWREGLNEAITTSKTILDLMDEFPCLTFIRGEAALYEHIEKNDPKTFSRIAQRVEEGRWELVGGTYIQPDTNLTGTETFVRHFLRGQKYFENRFGRRVKVAWAADSFGHSAGLPEIFAAAGIEAFSFSRPDNNAFPLKFPAFWWQARSGAKILAYRIPVAWYGCERDEAPRRLDSALQEAVKYPFKNIGVYLGLGNHGGGPTRRHILDILNWAKSHPEVTVEFSGLHRLTDAIRKEAEEHGKNFLPTICGELNFCLRGCYASMAKLKFAYRRAEAFISKAENTATAISAQVSSKTANFAKEWDALLFNSFHDILPGTSIERAFSEQFDWLHGAVHSARVNEFDALNALSMQINVPDNKNLDSDHPTPVSFIVFNPHPREFRGPVEVEASLDYRPIFKYANRPSELPLELRDSQNKLIPFQEIPTEHSFMTFLPWRKRLVFKANVPAFGWSLYKLGWIEEAKKATTEKPVSTGKNSISNQTYKISANVGDKFIHILKNGKSVFHKGGIYFNTVSDPWGSWGGHYEEKDSFGLQQLLHEWKISDVQIIEKGPERAKLWCRLEGGNSKLDLSFLLVSGRSAVDVSGRLLWNERSARLKMVLPAGEEAEFEVPGGIIKRAPRYEVPGGRWVRIYGKNKTKLGFASDSFYCFDSSKNETRVTIVRATRFAAEACDDGKPWTVFTDQGEHLFKFLLSPGEDELPILAEELEKPPIVHIIPAPGKGKLPATGSIFSIAPSKLKLLALKPAEDGNGYIVRIQNLDDKKLKQIVFTWLGNVINIKTEIKPFEIACWRLSQKAGKWQATRVNILED